MNRTKFASALLVCAGLVPLLTGCASIMCGSTQAVSIDSRPRGADVLVYNSSCEVIYKDTTPCVAPLRRRSGDSKKGTYVVVLKKPGFDSTQVPLQGRVNGAYYLNIVCGCVGLLVDPITGAMWTLGAEKPDGHSVRDNASFFQHDGLYVCLNEQPGATNKAPATALTTPAAKSVGAPGGVQVSTR